nr:hypothetical protein [Gemmatimonadota bacterium]
GFLDYRGRERSSDFYDNILPELRDAVNDERVLATEAGQGLALYWRARQKVVDYAHEQGFVNINRAKALATDRARLYEIGTRIAIEYPDFARLWDRHLRHEVQPQEEAA